MIVGVDVSSKRIDLAWLEDGRPQRWHQQLDPKAHLIDRLRSIHIQWPMGTISIDMPEPHGTVTTLSEGWDVTDVAIEMPFGQSRKSVGALMATVGVVTKQTPGWARVAWPSSGELRQAIGAKNTKQDAHLMVRGACYPDHLVTVLDWDEHELDALVAAVGWTRILEANA